MTIKSDLQNLCTKYGIEHSALGGLAVFSPIDGSEIAKLEVDSERGVATKLEIAHEQQEGWAKLCPNKRAETLQKFADAMEVASADLSKIVTYEAGKTAKEAVGEVENFVKVLRTNCAAEIARQLPDLGVMRRVKIYKPVGVVGLITSFNFPLAVAGWTIAPALLAGNGCVWKPSEKTPLTALFVRSIFERALPDWSGLLEVVVGEVAVGKALVESAKTNMISATGSVAMAQSILATRANLGLDKAPPIIEAGGNNAMIISQHNSPENLKFALESLLNSFLAGGGQKCTNTRRLFVQEQVYDEFVGALKEAIKNFLETGGIKAPTDPESAPYGYGPLIDEYIYSRYMVTLSIIEQEKGEVSFGKRVLRDRFPDAHYIEPAIAEMPSQVAIMHEECFAPLLFVVKYENFSDAIAMMNAPENAGLVNGIYTQSKAEFEEFVEKNEAGHTVVNSPTGTGTPAHGMGFGGTKKSGTGEILNGDNQLLPFTCGSKRVAINKNVELS